MFPEPGPCDNEASLGGREVGLLPGQKLEGDPCGPWGERPRPYARDVALMGHLLLPSTLVVNLGTQRQILTSLRREQAVKTPDPGGP